MFVFLSLTTMVSLSFFVYLQVYEPGDIAGGQDDPMMLAYNNLFVDNNGMVGEVLVWSLGYGSGNMLIFTTFIILYTAVEITMVYVVPWRVRRYVHAIIGVVLLLFALNKMGII
jgi:hypothetical protein